MDEVIGGTWAPAAEGWGGDKRTVGIYVNLRSADALTARCSADRRHYQLCAVYGIGPDREPHGLVVPLAHPKLYTERKALEALDKLVRVISAPSRS